MRKTKVVVTVGPALLNGGPLEAVLEIADAVRINASHSTPEERTPFYQLVRETAERLGRKIPIFLDLQGPKWRVGRMENQELPTGSVGVLYPAEGAPPSGYAWAVPLPHAELFRGAKSGQTWVLDDGNLVLELTEVRSGYLVASVKVGGLLKPRKGVHPIGFDVAFDPLTPKDLEDIRWGVEHDVDLFAQSFVRRATDVQALRATIRAYGGNQPVIAKIEHPQALDHLPEILESAWGVMVARGDLGVELGVEKVPSLQKHIIQMARQALKPVITATQMLESMIENPQPTRAEASDIANAIWDGTDAVMLSAESAAGHYPFEATQWLARIAEDADLHVPVSLQRRADRLPERYTSRTDISVAFAACHTAEELKAKLLLVFTEGGGSARMVSRLAGNTPVVGATTDPKNARRMSLLRGVRSLVVERTEHLSEMVASVEPVLKAEHDLKPGDRVVMTLGHPLWSAGSTNTMRVLNY
ncbi:MAG: pyruvate kinase [Firmicutes bacterium]|nr:pyruvate kinase [Bacillota bacterium]